MLNLLIMQQEKKKGLPKVAPMAFGRRIGEASPEPPRLLWPRIKSACHKTCTNAQMRLHDQRLQSDHASNSLVSYQQDLQLRMFSKQCQ